MESYSVCSLLNCMCHMAKEGLIMYILDPVFI
jgi:hypothetical protein